MAALAISIALLHNERICAFQVKIVKTRKLETPFKQITILKMYS